eukprot:2682485-Rhodomonas_salina.1
MSAVLSERIFDPDRGSVFGGRENRHDCPVVLSFRTLPGCIFKLFFIPAAGCGCLCASDAGTQSESESWFDSDAMT